MNYTDLQISDFVFSIDSAGNIFINKNRYGKIGHAEFPELLQLLLQKNLNFKKKDAKLLVEQWITKLKNLGPII